MDDPLWFKDAIIYELHVRAFYDGNQDGIGDFIGLTQKLDYLSDLGITAVWLLPFTCSPLKDDGYDIADYTSVHPNYGTMDDFREFLDKAHSVGIRVITELVINHTSDQHPWFQRARRAPPGSTERNFYVWSDDPEKYSDVPLMFPDFENSNWAWDPIAKQYYWHRFYSHQPDLNFDNPAVRQALMPVVDFWFEMGVDGMRLDAVPYLIEREGTTCEHLPETHAFLKDLRRHIDQKFPGRMLLAEANAWPDDMVAYFGTGDECQMAFHFPLMPRLFMALHQEDRFPIVDILAQTPAIPADCQWCLFLRNHDELTLAMVTDEERDAMYTAYARDRQARLFLGIRHRLAPLLRNDRQRIELMNAILFSLPGTPVIYYGDEIGMGDNIYLGDRNGVRTPMQWSADRNAGFSKANSQKLYLPVIAESEYHYEALNVEAQQNNSSSLLWKTKRLIAMRKQHPAFGRGELRVLEPDNSKVLAYVRQTETECLLIVLNLSRFVQNVRLDLSAYEGSTPEELFGRTRFPAIRPSEPYGLTIGPHDFYWLALEPQANSAAPSSELPTLAIRGWSDLFRGPTWDRLSAILAARHSIDSPTQTAGCRLLQHRPLPISQLDGRFLICRLEYSNETSETLFQPLALIPEERFASTENLPQSIAMARTGPPMNALLCDPIGLPEYTLALLALAEGKPTARSSTAELVYLPWKDFATSSEALEDSPAPTLFSTAKTLSTVALNSRLVLRVFRRPDEGVNPDVEIGKYLAENEFEGFARILGTIEYRAHGLDSITLGAIHDFVPNHGDAWQMMLDQSSRFFEAMAAQSIPASPESDTTTSDTADRSAPDNQEQWELLVSPFLETTRSLAAYTAELHLLLAAAPKMSSLAAVPVQPRSFYQTLRNAAGRLHARLADPDPAWPDAVRDLASQVKALYKPILKRILPALDPELAERSRIRCHGKYRLGQILVSGHQFILTNFEGRNDQSIGERRVKRSPLYDVASLLSSLDYAVGSMRLELGQKVGTRTVFVRPEDRERLKSDAEAWLARLYQEFFLVYSAALEHSNLLPKSPAARQQLLDLSLLEAALSNAQYDLNQRPEWALIPLAAIIQMNPSDPVVKP